MIEFILPVVCIIIFGAIGFAISKGDPTLGVLLAVFGITMMWHMVLLPDWAFLVTLAGLGLFMAWKFSKIWG